MTRRSMFRSLGLIPAVPFVAATNRESVGNMTVEVTIDASEVRDAILPELLKGFEANSRGFAQRMTDIIKRDGLVQG